MNTSILSARLTVCDCSGAVPIYYMSNAILAALLRRSYERSPLYLRDYPHSVLGRYPWVPSGIRS